MSAIAELYQLRQLSSSVSFQLGVPVRLAINERPQRQDVQIVQPLLYDD